MDANNLYGWAMSQPLPIRDFKWMDGKELEKWTNYGCILEVDLEYPEKLHDKHNEYLTGTKVNCENSEENKWLIGSKDHRSIIHPYKQRLDTIKM